MIASSLLGNLPSFSRYQVTNIDGNTITFHVDNVSDLSQTPLPPALPLFATGLGVMGLLAWRRKRKAAAV